MALRGGGETGVPAAGPALGSGAAPVPRSRSFCFLERSGERWTVYLLTYRRADGRWCGEFLFRAATGVSEEELRTATLFVESTEAEVDARARSLGRPLVGALLDSAVAVRERRRGSPAELHAWFRRLLAKHAEARPRAAEAGAGAPELEDLRALYDSYRLDQVAHLVGLIEPETFRDVVARLLEGRTIDFRAGDRFQLAMLAVAELERHLPLPPFEVWVEDYLAHRAEYRRYAQRLLREGLLA